MLILRKIYNWVLTWADKPSGAKILGLMSAAEASFFPIPPDVLLIPLALGKREKALYFGLICSFYSIIGATIGYGIGKLIWYSDLNTFSTFAEFFLGMYLVFHMNLFLKLRFYMMNIIS